MPPAGPADGPGPHDGGGGPHGAGGPPPRPPGRPRAHGGCLADLTAQLAGAEAEAEKLRSEVTGKELLITKLQAEAASEAAETFVLPIGNDQ